MLDSVLELYFLRLQNFSLSGEQCQRDKITHDLFLSTVQWVTTVDLCAPHSRDEHAGFYFRGWRDLLWLHKMSVHTHTQKNKN